MAKYWMALLAVVAPVTVKAGEVSTSLTITTTVVNACRVSTQPITLGTYQSGGSAISAQAAGAIEVSCTQGSSAQIYIDGRQLSGPNGARLQVALSSQGKPWLADEPMVITGHGAKPVVLPVTATLPAGQVAAPGDYRGDEVVRVVY